MAKLNKLTPDQIIKQATRKAKGQPTVMQFIARNIAIRNGYKGEELSKIMAQVGSPPNPVKKPDEPKS